MVTLRPHIEQTGLTTYIPPKGDFEVFRDDDHYREKLKEWGLSSAKEAKREFWYKDRHVQRLVTIKGYETYGNSGEFNTLVIGFQDGQLSCIHPAYLKEMQQSSFGKESMLTLGDKESVPVSERGTGKESVAAAAPVEAKASSKKEKAAKAAKPKKEKIPKLELPAEKVHFTAKVKQFALVYNPFNEENDEVVVLEEAQIVQEPPLELGFAWCSHSKTLKKFELAPGDVLEFDGKVAAKKLAKGKDVPEEFIIDVPVLYKVNNPSKIAKK
ncbi:hypothetical protein RCG19_20040 [Neobacillus sp. OS1-2]|uniref:hypothetical protein n=1 Tax=Neobacillus sp. OS1-2 TaxID=3070680 RepID=UPI0027E0CD31|nr:hypothetical protein [Neobacillus sp. OS1-2]WML39446.1 hypothetical protein RCG19_20040 [Neobacillus sp. OS1-2]